MPMLFDDPYDGGAPDISLGQSKIQPRETYAVDPRAIGQQYSDKMRNANQLLEALSGFAGAVNGLGKKQEKDQVDQASAIAGQLSESLKNGENIDLQIGTLRPDLSPLARAAVAEVIGRERGQADAMAIYEKMPLDVRNDPAKAQQYFEQHLSESAKAHVAAPFYNNARTDAMRKVFSGASSSLTSERVGKMKEILSNDARKTFQETTDRVANGYRDNPAAFTGGSARADRILSSPLGSAVRGAAERNGLDPNVLATIISIESGGNPNAKTGSYTGLGQLSAAEWAKYGDPSKSITDPEANLEATARSLADKSRTFAREHGRTPGAVELYMQHQQGEAGLRSHLKNPDQPAWMSMLQTGEGKQKGEGWARKAIWGNIADKDKERFGSVDNVTSKQFIEYWGGKMGMRPGGNVKVASLVPSGEMPLPNLDGDTKDQSAGNPKVERDFAGRPENLPPQVSLLREQILDMDKQYNFTHPTVANAEKRDMMVESVVSTATRMGDKEWLKAVPDRMLTPDLRDKLKKVEMQIDANTRAAETHARQQQNEQRTAASRDWNAKANEWIIKNPGSPPPPELIEEAFKIGDPELVSGFNSRRMNVIQGLTNPKIEDRNVQALENEMIRIAAGGGDARRVNINSINDPAKHTKLIEFGNTLAKNGGEFSNEFYNKQWQNDSRSLYGFQFGVPLVGGATADPKQVDTDHFFKRRLAEHIAVYAAKEGGAPINDMQRLDIYQKALADVKLFHKPPNDAGARVSGGQANPGDPEQDRLKAAQKKYQLGK